MEFFQGHWWWALAAIVAFALLAWWIGLRSRRTRVERTSRGDVLDEGAERARRNQALIDAPLKAETSPAPARAPPPTAGGDDLTRIKGLGPKIAALLGSLGVTSFAQIAAWDEAEIDRIDAQLGDFAGRIRRDNWVEQAKFLAANDIEGFEAKFGAV
jgi:predicted flap endonuclease-1-like 5' DNA nuclease